MQWKKLGNIFDPTKYQLINHCSGFAQSPQALVFNDFIRIYFSTREKDANGKYLSHISFVEIDKEFKKVINLATKTVIELGGVGCYDEHGIFPMNILRDGNRILGYISGWSRRASVSIETSIGLAVSDDEGLTFKRIGDGPILTSSLYEPFLVGDPFVFKYEDTYHMWYIYGIQWMVDQKTATKERIYKIGHARSSDGIAWKKTGGQIIHDKLGLYECQALPTVIKINNLFHMFFCYRQATDFRKNTSNAYRIGYAYSSDMLNWIRADDQAGIDVSESGWDSEMLCYPHVFRCDNRIFMLYNGNEFGRFGFGVAMLVD